MNILDIITHREDEVCALGETVVHGDVQKVTEYNLDLSLGIFICLAHF